MFAAVFVCWVPFFPSIDNVQMWDLLYSQCKVDTSSIVLMPLIIEWLGSEGTLKRSSSPNPRLKMLIFSHLCVQYQLLYLSAVHDSGQSELLLPCMEVVLLVQGAWKPPWTASPSCAHALRSQRCKYKFTLCFEVCVFFTLRPMTYFLKVTKWVMQWKTSRIYPKHKRKPIFHSQFCHLLVFISEVQIWDFFLCLGDVELS